MELTMDWIKKNWITIAVVVLIVAVIIYFLKRKKKATTGIVGAKAASGPSIKDQLASCEKTAQGIRLLPGSPHPCAGLRDAAAKESGYFMQGGNESGYNIDDKLNVVDYAIGNQGMGMLEENNFGLPSFKLRESGYKGVPSKGKDFNLDGNVNTSDFGGAFSTGNGLNVVDFASGLEGTSLLMDRNLGR